MIDIKQKLNKLKKQRNAIILAHYYQINEIQEIADFVGDSLELSKIAKDSKSDTIVFCGVDFMADSAKLLSPDKTVLLPVKDATCPMANMVTSSDILKIKQKHPTAAVVCYINSTVDVKTVSDISCTSSNAVDIVNSLPNDKIIFVPDRNLASYVSRFTDKEIIVHTGYCPIHDYVTAEDVKKARVNHPDAELLVHPECLPEVVDLADYVGSTSKILKYVQESSNKDFIISTEQGILFKLKEFNPDKNFHMITNDFTCYDMKKITLADVVNALNNNEYEILLDKQTIDKASICLNRMMNIK